MVERNGLGRGEGPENGPKPGDGGVVHDQSGEADFDGLPNDALPPRKGPEEAKPYPPERAAD